MSTEKLVRRPDMIGSNIKPGRVPGGFSTMLGAGKSNSRRGRPSAAVIKAAAEETLQRHGFVQGSGEFDCRAQPKVP